MLWEMEREEERGLTQGFEKFIKMLTALHLPGAGKVGHVCWGWAQRAAEGTCSTLVWCFSLSSLTLTLLLFPCAPVPPLLTLTLKMQVCFWASFKCILYFYSLALTSTAFLCALAADSSLYCSSCPQWEEEEGPHPSQKCCPITMGARLYFASLYLLSPSFKNRICLTYHANGKRIKIIYDITSWHFLLRCT